MTLAFILLGPITLEPQQAPTPTARPAQGRLIVVVVDSLRAKALDDHMPRTAEIAQAPNGARREVRTCSANFTLPCMQTLMEGRQSPFAAGLHNFTGKQGGAQNLPHIAHASGRTTDFRQTLIFLTSNLGASRTSMSPVGFGEEAARSQKMSAQITRKLDEFFAPEFLNRLDQVLTFAPLTPGAMGRLVELELGKAMGRRGLAAGDWKVDLDEGAHSWLAEHGFSARFGARELKRVIERHVLTPIGRLIVEAGHLGDDRRQIVGRLKAGELVFELGPLPPTRAAKASRTSSRPNPS